MKKIWIVGSLGHMGQALIRLLDMMEYELYETDKDELDITCLLYTSPSQRD